MSDDDSIDNNSSWRRARANLDRGREARHGPAVVLTRRGPRDTFAPGHQVEESDTDAGSALQEIEREAALYRQMQQGRELEPARPTAPVPSALFPLLYPPFGSSAHDMFSNPPGLEPGAKNKVKQKEPRQPITTLVSALPKTTYREQDEPEGTERTLGYVRVQRSLLSWLAVNPADSLTALQARKWTEAIEPKNLAPMARDALRLCYYMRLQTFDTYAKISNGYISLYVVNQNSHIRSHKHDRLYWKQSFKTNYVDYMAPSSGARDSRRNAVEAALNHNIAGNTHDSRSHLSAAGLTPAERALLFPGTAPEQPVPASTTATTPAPAPTAAVAGDIDTLNSLREAAERNLDRFLTEENPDTNAISAALEQIEEIMRQMQ